VKCRTRRALDFRTHIAASGLSWGFVCLRVGMILKSLYKSAKSSMPSKSCCTRQTYSYTWPSDPSVSGLVVGCVLSFSSLTITAEHYTFCWSLTFCTISLSRGTYLRFMVADSNHVYVSNKHIYLILSTSDQARLPAEFKHINKRWKRNQTGYP